MSIIISKNGEKAQKIDKSDFTRESDVQEYINQNPESIPIYEIKEDKKLFVAKREFSTNAGPLDALAVDKDGDIYIVETKLYKNPDKRTVVAQALDYGAALWKHMNDFSEFIAILDNETQKRFNLSFQEKLKEFYEIDNDQVEVLLNSLKSNLDNGNIKFVVLMDSIDERLKDLILYVNQNSQFDIYAVQLEYYKFEEYEIMIPKIFGIEVKKKIKTTSSSQRRKWDEISFFTALDEQLDTKYHKSIKEIYDFSKMNAEIKWGTGVSTGSFNSVFSNINSRSIYTIGTDGKLSINFGWLAGSDKLDKFCINLKQELENKTGLTFPDDYRTHYPTYQISEWANKVDIFISIIKKLTQ